MQIPPSSDHASLHTCPDANKPAFSVVVIFRMYSSWCLVSLKITVE
jgi:hypothetical protein